MHKTTIKINKVEIENFQPKECKASIRILFTKDNSAGTVTKEFQLKDPFNIARKLLLAVKSTGKIIVEAESDDVLENIYITQLTNEDETEEKLLAFFQNLCTNVSKLRTIKEAKAYMKLVDQIKTTKMEI